MSVCTDILSYALQNYAILFKYPNICLKNAKIATKKSIAQYAGLWIIFLVVVELVSFSVFIVRRCCFFEDA